MKDWGPNGGGGLPALRWETKMIYTLYLGFSVIGFAVMGVLASTRTGWAPGKIAAYYIGDESMGLYGKTAGELIELTHFHLFAIPLFLFITGHVFLLSRWPARLKAGVVFAAFVGAAGLIAAPWLMVYHSPHWSLLTLVSRVLLAGSFLIFLAAPFREMWGRERAENKKAVS
jgi:hypothetical protein